MKRARCGNPDLGTVTSIKRPLNVDVLEPAKLAQGRTAKVDAPQSYETQANTWPKNDLKWFIEEYPKQQKSITSHEQIRTIMKQAFDDWEKHSGLRFEMAKSKEAAELKIRFDSKDHGDGYPFDGQGATLAHAFYPVSGNIHFDDDERFTDDYTSTSEHYTLRLVAAHEIGHALGLSHSFEEDSLMFPVYQQFAANYNISQDDREGIQTLYGKPNNKTEEKPGKTTAPPKLSTLPSNHLPADNWCSADFQTGCEGPDGELYLFKDHEVWRYQARGRNVWDVAPKAISERFPTLSDTSITACVRSSTGYTYLFRNYRMWKVKTHWAIDGPHILHGKHYPQNPRVALFHHNSIYLVRNRLIYRLNEFDRDRQLEIRTIDSILNPPPRDSIRAGFTYAKRHYIFTRNQVYVYDSTDGHLLSGYPKPKTNGWFACESASVAPSLNKQTTKVPHRHHHHHHHHHHHSSKRPSHRHRDD